jgi:hypothetical protein
MAAFPATLRAGSAAWWRAGGGLDGATASVAVSSEPDYLSLTGGGALRLELDRKRLLPGAGYAPSATRPPSPEWRAKSSPSRNCHRALTSDGDGIGDACDPCSLDPGATCSAAARSE